MLLLFSCSFFFKLSLFSCSFFLALLLFTRSSCVLFSSCFCFFHSFFSHCHFFALFFLRAITFLHSFFFAILLFCALFYSCFRARFCFVLMSANRKKSAWPSPLVATEPDRNRISSGIYGKTATPCCDDITSRHRPSAARKLFPSRSLV
jgi:hypothetical protein